MTNSSEVTISLPEGVDPQAAADGIVATLRGCARSRRPDETSYRLAVDLRCLLSPPKVSPAERLPIAGTADGLLVQMVLGRSWPMVDFSFVEVDGYAVALVHGAPAAVLPLEEWQRRLTEFIEAQEPALPGAFPGHVVIVLSAQRPR